MPSDAEASAEPPAKRVRKGTKSCVECRHRKIRCVWPSEGEGADACQSCQARGRSCQLQVYMTPASDAPRLTSRARIGHLEGNVSGLWSAVRNLERRLGCEPSGPGPTVSEVTGRALPDDAPSNAAGDDASDTDSASNASDLSPANPPSHLLQLFDNGLLSSDGAQPATTLSRRGSTAHQTHENAALRRLIPSREDMCVITAHASSWLAMYNMLFPLVGGARTSDEMLRQYDRLQNPNAGPVEIATLLLSVALTVQQAPEDTTSPAAGSIGNADVFIKQVSDTVDRILISDDNLIGSLEGIEMTLLFFRLQMGRAKVRKTWLLLRRVIALAELIGLPRASMAIAQPGANPALVDRHRHKAEVWEIICVVDRLNSMMWSLPLATINWPLPERPLTSPDGAVNHQAYLYHLADIASRVLELDNIYSSARPLTELFNAVMSTDQDLRTLAARTPAAWWRTDWATLSTDPILQYWHRYLTVRTHLQLALAYDSDPRFAFDFITCRDACAELARRYLSLRPLLPPGFFANRVIDLHAFTAAVFLLLAGYRSPVHSSTAPPGDVDTALVDHVVRTMATAAERAGGDFARQAAAAVHALAALLNQGHPAHITLSLPLVGRIHVARKPSSSSTGLPPSTLPSSLPPGSSQPLYPLPLSSKPQPHPPAPWPHTTDLPPPPLLPTGTLPTTTTSTGMGAGPGLVPYRNGAGGGADLDLLGMGLSYSMEVPDSYSFLADEALGAGEWLTWSGVGSGEGGA